MIKIQLTLLILLPTSIFTLASDTSLIPRHFQIINTETPLVLADTTSIGNAASFIATHVATAIAWLAAGLAVTLAATLKVLDESAPSSFKT